MPLLAPMVPAVAPKLIGQIIVSREVVMTSGAPLRNNRIYEVLNIRARSPPWRHLLKQITAKMVARCYRRRLLRLL